MIGYAVNLPTALLVLAIAKLTAKASKDEASTKVVVGALAFPLTWLAAGVLVAWGFHLLHAAYPKVPDAPFLTGALAFALSAAGGAVALHYWRLARGTGRAIRVRLTRVSRAETIRRLKQERGEIYGVVMALAEGLKLPGEVTADGRIVPAPN